MNFRYRLIPGVLRLASATAIGCAMGALPSTVLADQAENNQAAIVGAEISTIAKQLSLRPKTALDFSKVSGEYCFFMGWDSNHTHYAIDPSKTPEDTIDFVDARPLLEAGVELKGLPPAPGELGKMIPKQWYFLAAGELDLHHGERWEFPLMIRASNIE